MPSRVFPRLRLLAAAAVALFASGAFEATPASAAEPCCVHHTAGYRHVRHHHGRHHHAWHHHRAYRAGFGDSYWRTGYGNLRYQYPWVRWCSTSPMKPAGY